MARLAKHSEVRNISVNLAWISADPDDYKDFTFLKLQKLAKQLFFQNEEPHAPRLWPRSFTIGLVGHSTTELPPKTKWKPFALGAVVLAFWWSLSIAKQKGSAETVAAFHRLARAAAVDWKYFSSLTETDLLVAEANWSEQFESVREFFGGTGLALVRLVQQVLKTLLGKKEKVTGESMAKFLAENISWGHAPRFA